MTNPAKAQAIIDATPPELRQQLFDVLDYLDGCARTGHVPEGSVATFLNKQHPAIQANIRAIKEAADLPRDRPFAPKLTDVERYDSFGLNADTATMIGDALDANHVLNSLQSRMGTDAALPDQPLTTRDHIAAAMEQQQ
jgi:hypothetical protein